MEQRKEIIRSFVSEGMRITDAAQIAGVKKSTYYYQTKGIPRGKRPSTHTKKHMGDRVVNQAVVDNIVQIITPEYNDYGYQTVTQLLRDQGFIINPKKVYRLMKENKLLHPKMVKNQNIQKTFIKHTVPLLEAPFKTIEADIKYIYLFGQQRNAYLLTFLCTFCRYAIAWELESRMQAQQVTRLVKQVMDHPLVKENIQKHDINVVIRTDNGPQFIAKILAEVLDDKGISHEFINPGTPQQNAHIESFHSTVTRLVCRRNLFMDLDHAKKIFEEFYHAYNNTRVMQCLLYKSPRKFIDLWNSGKVEIKRNKKNKEIFCLRETPPALKSEGIPHEASLVLNKNMALNQSIINLQEISPV